VTPPLESFHVKICGLTRLRDAEAAVDAGADMIGLNFVPSSPRNIDVSLAKSIAQALRGRARIIGVFADEDEARIRFIQSEVPLDLIQLHGQESPEFVRTIGSSAFKAVAVGAPEDIELAKTYPGAWLLVDARVAGQLGGTGVRIDPHLVAPLARSRSLLLAGGLRPENVAEAVQWVRPRGVDVASGVETLPGVKDEGMMRSFIAEARRAAREAFESDLQNE
jgi:phosphoribosylanthranilate isomerase